MPFSIEERNTEAPEKSGAFLLRLRLWPHSSLTPKGFVWAIGLAYGLLSLPLLGLIGTAALWGILPFALCSVAVLWIALKRSWRDREITEVFELTSQTATLTRQTGRGGHQAWEANPYWVRVMMNPKDGPVEDYVTLEGGPRAVEIGAFLTPEERRELQALLADAFGLARQAGVAAPT